MSPDLSAAFMPGLTLNSAYKLRLEAILLNFSKMGPHTLFRAVKKLAVYLTSTLALFVFLDLTLSLVSGHARKNNATALTTTEIYYSPAPYVIFHPLKNFDQDAGVRVSTTKQTSPYIRKIHINKNGFRYDQDLEKVPPADEFRIFLLGGSVVFNGETNQSTISGELEKRLKARFPNLNIKCINAGIVSAVSDQELAWLVHHIVDFSPNIVISLSGFNDVLTRYQYEHRTGYPFRWNLYESSLQNNRGAFEAIERAPVHRILLGRSFILTKIFPSLLPERWVMNDYVKDQATKTLPPEMDITVDHFLANWNKMYRIAVAHGIKMIRILQEVDPVSRRNYRYLRTFYDKVGMAIKPSVESKKDGIYSFDGILKEHPEYFFDQVHAVEDVNAIYAAEIEKILVTDAWIENIQVNTQKSKQFDHNPTNSWQSPVSRSAFLDVPKRTSAD